MTKRRLIALLLALTAFLGVMGAPPAAADGPIGNGVEIACKIGSGPILGSILDKVADEDLCDKVGDATEKAMKQAWKAVWDSVLGDVIRSAIDVGRWQLKKVLTVALLGPSLNLEETGLFGENASLAGMLVWLGWVIATFGLMWQLGKMAVTGQMKYAGQALVGWVQNALLTGIGLTIVAALLKLGDVMTVGLVDKVFDGVPYERIVKVLLPAGVLNPILMLGVVQVMLIVGFIQMILIFLRQSAIPIQCLLLPIAGAGRVGGDATRQWAPRLITSIFVVIVYKPILAVIICTGFAEFGHSQTLVEWLRGVATLVLGVLAPGPLTKLFAPLGAEIGAGLSAGGAMGAAASAGAYIGGRSGGSDKGGDSDGGAEPTSAVEHARYVEQTMGSQRSGEPDSRGEAVVHASRTEAGAKVPAQAGAGNAAAGAETGAAAGAGAGAGAGAAGAGAGTGAAAGGAAAGGAAAAGPAGAAVGVTIQVLDGINDAVQGASDTMGDGGNKL